MSKGLKALEDIGQYEVTDYAYKGAYPTTFAVEDTDDYDIIKSELKRLEEHDKIFKEYDIDDNWLDLALYTIKNHFPMNTETQLSKIKALEIIKEKKVAISILLMSENAYVYNELYEVVIIPSGTTSKYEWKLTDTEFETIREGLK